MSFSQNQVQHLYVINNVDTAGNLKDATKVASVAKGSLYYDSTNKKEFVGLYKGAKGSYRTDMFKGDKILKVSLVSGQANSQKRALKSWVFTISDDALLATGEVCILRLTFRNWVGMSDLDVYTKDVAVKVTKGMDRTAFNKAMCTALKQAFARELEQVLSFSYTATAVTITETRSAEDNWRRGLKKVAPINLTVSGDIITISDSVEAAWAVNSSKTAFTEQSEFGVKIPATDTSNFVTNAKDIADLEYFTLGNRGDMYRGAGWPDNIPTEYLVTDTDSASTSYDVVNVHYYFEGAGVQSAKSERDMTFVFKHSAAITNLSTGTTPAEKLYNYLISLDNFKGEKSAVLDDNTVSLNSVESTKSVKVK